MRSNLLKVAIVIPAFNEEKTIGRVVNSVSEYGTVIVVNDASTDNTHLEAKKTGAIVINHTKNKGYDEALNSGFKKASELKQEAIVTFDADGQHSHKLLPIYIEHLTKGFQLVLGVRPRKQRISELLFSFYTKLKLGWNDPLCGMKGYSMDLYNQLGYFDSLNSTGTELALFGIKNDFQFIEIKIPEIKRLDSPRFHSLITANYKIIRSMIRLIKKYR